MRWRIKTKGFKNTAAVMMGIAAAVLLSCQNEAPKESALKRTRYPDLPLFFQQEIDSLQQAAPLVEKQVQKDELTEQKRMQIKNWETELASFRSVDLNKAAYEGLIEIDSAGGVMEYHFQDSTLDLSCVRIRLGANRMPEMISIERDVKNSLYHTTEVLVYEKDAFYLVEKNQKVRLLGGNFYRVMGTFVPHEP